jgi:hypothetical protein
MLKKLRPSLCSLLCCQLICTSLLWAQQTDLRISVLTGEGATNYIDNRQGTPPVVQVLDAEGEPVAGAQVRFSAPVTGPSVTFFGASHTATVVTDQEGRAQVAGILPNTYEGAFIIEATASHEGRSATASINQTNARVEPLPKKKIRLGWRALAGIGAAVAIGIVAAVRSGGEE